MAWWVRIEAARAWGVWLADGGELSPGDSGPLPWSAGAWMRLDAPLGPQLRRCGTLGRLLDRMELTLVGLMVRHGGLFAGPVVDAAGMRMRALAR